MVKVRLKNRIKYNNISEAEIPISKVDVDYEKTIKDMFNKIYKKKKLDYHKLYSGNGSIQGSGMAASPDELNKDIEVEITDKATGSKHTEIINIAQVVAICDRAKIIAMSDSNLGVILGRFPKNVIWTFKVPTACSDGIRIAFNPVFAQELINLNREEAKAFKKADLPNHEKKNFENQKILKMCKYFLFVLIHEAYHELYRHKEQAELKAETENGKNHELANIAMDAEINRDIEKQLASMFMNATKTIGGIIDDQRFPIETWDIIFDAYYTGQATPPQSEDPDNNNSNDSNMPNNNDVDTKSDDYVDGWNQAIKDYESGKLKL